MEPSSNARAVGVPAGILLASLAAALIAPSAIAGDDGLTVEKAKLKFPRRVRAHTALVKGRFIPGAELRHTTFDAADVACLLGDLDLRDVETTRLRQTGQERWIAKGKVDGGRFRLALDLRLGKFRLKTRGVDLSAVRAGGAADVDFVLGLRESEFAATIDFDERHSRWTYRYRPLITPDPPGNGGGDGNGNGGGNGNGNPPQGLRLLASGDTGQITAPSNRVLTSAGALAQLWQQLLVPNATPPQVDFSTEVVAVVFIGTRATGGYSVAVKSATASGNDVVVSHQESAPGANCIVTQALSAPYVLVAVPKPAGQVRFTALPTAVNNCP